MVFFFSLSFFKFCLNKRILSRGQFYSLFQYFFFSYLSFVWWAVKVLLKVWIKRILSGGRVCGGQWIERTKKSISGSSNYSSGKLSKTLRENIHWKRKYFFKRKPLENKLGDAIAISKFETINDWPTHSLAGVGARRCYRI